MYECGQIPVCHTFYKRFNSPGLDCCPHFDPDNLVTFPWKAEETEIFVTQTCWSWSTLWLVLPVFCVNPCYFMTVGFKYSSSTFSLIQSMLHVFSHVISGRRQTGQSVRFFPERFNNKKKHSNAKTTRKKIARTILNISGEFQPFFLTFILNLNMQGGLSTSIHIPSLLSGPNIESGFKALQMLLLLSNYEQVALNVCLSTKLIVVGKISWRPMTS